MYNVHLVALMRRQESYIGSHGRTPKAHRTRERLICSPKRLEVVGWLLEAGAARDAATTNDRDPAKMYAHIADRDDCDSWKLLYEDINLGDDEDANDVFGATALHMAAKNVQLLLEAGAARMQQLNMGQRLSTLLPRTMM